MAVAWHAGTAYGMKVLGSNYADGEGDDVGGSYEDQAFDVD